MARDVVRDHGDDGMPRGLTVTVSTAPVSGTAARSQQAYQNVW